MGRREWSVDFARARSIPFVRILAALSAVVAWYRATVSAATTKWRVMDAGISPALLIARIPSASNRPTGPDRGKKPF
jgi:hypothetical protein